MKKIGLLLLLIIPLTAPAAPARVTWKEAPEWKEYFTEAQVEGTFLLYDLEKKEGLVYNPKRARTPFIPASTYKIFNSLVALETGAVRDENEIIKWDGVDRGSEGWNQDQNLRAAIARSTVWFYQEVARRIGQDRMRRYVDSAGYGNRDIRGGVDRFWLDGALRITPEQQIEFLTRLYRNDLPFSRRTTDIVKDVLVVERTEDYTLRAKTGWGQRFSPQVGWWVGYVERGGKAHFFAINIDINKPEDAKARTGVARSILRGMRVIE